MININKITFFLLLTINLILGQSIEIPNRLMYRNEIRNIPVFAYDLNSLESMTIWIRYDDQVLFADEIITDPFGTLGSSYSYTSNLTSAGLIKIIISNMSSTQDQLFSGNAMVAKITFRAIGDLGDASDIIFEKAEVNSFQCQKNISSIEIILDELVIVAEYLNSESMGNIVIGTCETCIDEWNFNEDLALLPDSTNELYSKIYIYHPEWVEMQDSDGNINLDSKFSTDFRQARSSLQRIKWGISGNIENDNLSNVEIKLKWNTATLINNSDNFKLQMKVGNDIVIDMSQNDYIIISKSQMDLNINNEANIWIELGNCSESELNTYYSDSDQDNWGSIYSEMFCSNFESDNWVLNNLDVNDQIYCMSNQIDCAGNCDGQIELDDCEICGGSQNDGDIDNDGDICEINCSGVIDCNGECNGTAVLDECNICGGPGILDGACDCYGNILDCNGECGGMAQLDLCDVCDADTQNDNQCFDCNNEPNGGAFIDNCGQCILVGENSVCIADCSGSWGGILEKDECEICGGNQYDGDIDGDGNICEIDCGVHIPDCNGDCSGIAYIDDCGNCVEGNTGVIPCEEDCNGILGGNSYIDQCGICDADTDNDNQCFDCNQVPNGTSYIDNCGNCVKVGEEHDFSCLQDCSGIWGGTNSPDYYCPLISSFVCNYEACWFPDNPDNNPDTTITDSSGMGNIKSNYFSPNRFDINSIYPNPFNPLANIDYQIKEPSSVRIEVFNINGQKVDELLNGYLFPGYYSIIWDGTNFTSGIYFIILNNSNSIIKKKVILLK